MAACTTVDLAIELRYKFWMLGFEIDGPTIMFGDNMLVVLNTTVPSSVLKKKHNVIAYHRVREAIAAGIIWFYHIQSEDNLVDVLTKPLPHCIFY